MQPFQRESKPGRLIDKPERYRWATEDHELTVNKKPHSYVAETLFTDLQSF